MAKILISSLGNGHKNNGDYARASYEIEGQVYETTFVADAITKHYKIDKLFLIGTKRSIWDAAYLAFDGDDEEYLLELDAGKERGTVTEVMLERFNKTVSTKLLSAGSKAIIIDYGIDDDELWHIFEQYLEVGKSIEDGDELYLDITHSFRSLSMMSLVMTQFARSISDKKFTIKGILYGMFEYSHEREDGRTPVVNLSILLEIQEWIKAIDAIKKYSDFDPLVEILEKEEIETEHKNENTFKELNNAIDMANMAAIHKFVQNASKKIRVISESNNKVIKLLAGEVDKLVQELSHERMSDFQYALAKWFYKNHNYAMSYMALAEGIVTKNCELKGLDRNDLDKENQKEVKSISYPYDKLFQTKYKDSISDIRNNIAHQLDTRSEYVQRDIQKLGEFIEEFESYFAKEKVN